MTFGLNQVKPTWRLRWKQILKAFTILLLTCSSLLLKGNGDMTLPDSVAKWPAEKRMDWLYREALSLKAEDNQKAYALFKMSEAIALELEDQTRWLDIQSRLARMLLVAGFWDECLEITFRGKEVARELADTTYLIEMHYWESGAYNQLQEFELAIAASEEAVRLNPLDRNPSQFGRALNSLGEAHRYQGNFEQAETYYLQAYQIFKEDLSVSEQSRQQDLSIVECNLAHTYWGMQAHGQAQVYLDRVHLGMETYYIFEVELEADLVQVEIWLAQGKEQAAMDLAEERWLMAKEKSNPFYRQGYAELLKNAYQAKGNFQKALQFQEEITALKEAERGSKAKFRMGMQEVELENLTLRSQNDVLAADRRWQKRLNLAFGGILLLLCVFIVYQIRNNRRTRKLNALLSSKNVQLEEANREVKGLIGIVAHDLKAPLNKSIMLAELLESQESSREMQAKTLGMIRKTCEDGGRLIQDLIEISSIESEKTVVKHETVELSSHLQGILDSFKGQSAKKGIPLILHQDQGDYQVKTDAYLLSRILDNLVSNAIKFTPPKGKVDVSLVHVGDRIGILVQDEGPGISEADQQKMFGRFQRLSAQPTGGESSNGLGLSIVKTLVERLGMDLEYETELGKGTVFKLWFS